MKPKACDGGDTIERRTTEHMSECQECGTAVRDDLVDHPFFGFQTCPRRAYFLATADEKVYSIDGKSVSEKEFRDYLCDVMGLERVPEAKRT